MPFSPRLSICLLAFCSHIVFALSIPNVKDRTPHLSPRNYGFRFGNLSWGGAEPSDPLAQGAERLDDISLPAPEDGCLFSKDARNCWRDNFNIDTDFDERFPTTGKTVTYNLEITNTTMAPDGIERVVMAVNGQYPGPTLIADWGDTMVINVKNSLDHNGTGLHFHGLRQYKSNGADGANGITECPIAPGETKTYTFQCTQHGSSWYHSHYSVQYSDGVLGGIIINGPADAHYDHDLGVYMLSDWYHTPMFELAEAARHSTRGPPKADNGLINGTMKSPDGSLGAYGQLHVKKGLRYRIRVMNVGTNDHYLFSVDGHNLTVIASDFVPVVPFSASSISLGVGQRYDVILIADQDIDNYWIRSDPDSACSVNGNAGNIKAILSYDTAPADAQPNSTRHNISSGCKDMAVVPRVANTVPSDRFAHAVQSLAMSVNITQQNGPLVQWYINGSAMEVDWSYPTVQYVLDGNTSYPRELNLVQLDEADQWYYFVIQTVQGLRVNLPHPIHLHGHDFYILGAGAGEWDGNIDGLQFDNPPRRDTAMLPAGGYLILAFPADNPGAWLMHCHIPFHVQQGFGLQFLERPDEIEGVMGDTSPFYNECAAWKDYYGGGEAFQQSDSGL
ncbi:laccase-1 precursor [Macrophomina phaseolina]|uniref:laccase n=1 Tax=Macrophomina phaseolina TaxID=35725 RepID=A0ABQ8G3A4_9PEZI|nr:laccase-1 precursor [Macrophomina phaseolina]